MGFSHYWRQYRDFTVEEWTKICSATNKILQNAAMANVVVAREYDRPRSLALVNEDEIRFNGIEDDGCETFRLTRLCGKSDYYETPSCHFNFCKTRGKPYDAVVVSVLAAARRLAPGVLKLSSDGGPKVFKNMFPPKKRVKETPEVIPARDPDCKPSIDSAVGKTPAGYRVTLSVLLPPVLSDGCMKLAAESLRRDLVKLAQEY